MPIIGGLQKVTLVDYPGKVACTVFLSGCNFRCPFCYSKELVLPEKIKDHPYLEEDYLFSFLEERKDFLDGVVLCGGEPTINSDLLDFCKKIKKIGFCIKLDTNGSNPEILKELIKEKLLDYIAMDIKAPLDQAKYNLANGAGISLEKIKESIEIIKKSGIDYEFRSTIVHKIHSKEDILQMARDIAPADKYFLQQFHGEKGTIDPNFSNLKPFEDKDLEEIKKQIESLFKIFKIR